MTVGWDVPLSDGCLTILNYELYKDGIVDVSNISPTAVSYVDDITVGGSIGETITYTLKAVNQAGESIHSEPLNIVVG